MEDEKKDATSPEKCSHYQSLQLIQDNNGRKYIACDLRNRNLAKCRSCLTLYCHKPYEVKRSLSVYSARSRLKNKSEENPKCKQSTKSPNKSKSNSVNEKNELESIKFRPKAIRRSVLKETNRYRDLHNARPLKMDENLTSYAQEWADHLACNNLLETRPLPLYGQNIICARKELFAVNQIMKLWYQEKYNYDYFKPEFDLYTGHFTQMVWRETEFLGVGVSSNDSRIWIVCNFNPPGNITGHFKENVHPRKTFFPASNFEDEQETHKSQETIFNEGKSVKFSLAKKIQSQLSVKKQ